jgi:hypothetical protein
MRSFASNREPVLKQPLSSTLTKVFALFVLLSPLSSNAALVDGPLGKIELRVNTRATFDSNVFAMPTRDFNGYKDNGASLESSEDLILELTPAAHFTKKMKLIEVQATLGARGAYFISNRDKSYVDPVTTFTVDFDESLSKRISNNGKIRFDANFDMGQKTVTSVLENDLTSYAYVSVGSNVRYNHSQKFGVGLSANYSYRDYQDVGANPNSSYQDVFMLPITTRAFYIYSPKLDFFTEYTRMQTEGGSSQNKTLDATTHTINFGAQGDVLTKASGSVHIGYVKKVFERNSFAQENLSLGTDLSWKLNQKTNIDINLDRSFQPSPQDQSILTTSFGVSLAHRLNEKMSGSINLSWSSSEYTTGPGSLSNSRQVDMITFGATATKKLSQRLSTSAGYTFSTAHQNPGNDFDRHTLYVDLTGTY